MVKKSIAEAGDFFRGYFDKLIAEGTVKVSVDLECSALELKKHATLWGLLVNAGYLTVTERMDGNFMTLRIPNGEVKNEFIDIVAERTKFESQDLFMMFGFLLNKDMEGFIEIYQKIVMSCTSYYDAKEYAYHMLFLGMCVSLGNLYKITSNVESGRGRSDIKMDSLTDGRSHIIIEFKQGTDINRLKKKVLSQIINQRYYDGLRGEVLCIGIAHNKKECGVSHEIVNIP